MDNTDNTPDEFYDHLPVSQSNPVREPEGTKPAKGSLKKKSNGGFFSRGKHKAFPGWFEKLRRMKWWKGYEIETIPNNIQRRLDRLLSNSPAKVLAEMKGLNPHDINGWLDFAYRHRFVRISYEDIRVLDGSYFSSRYRGHALSVFGKSGSERLDALYNWSEEAQKIDSMKREIFKKFKENVSSCVDEYCNSWRDEVDSMQRALTETRNQAESLLRKRNARVLKLGKFHGRKLKRVSHRTLKDVSPEED